MIMRFRGGCSLAKLFSGKPPVELSLDGYFPTTAIDPKYDLDLACIAHKVKSKHVAQVTASSHDFELAGLTPIAATNGPTFKRDLAAIIQSAKSVTSCKFSVYRADGGLPAHFTIKSGNGEPVPVCYSARAAVYAQLFSHVASLYLGGSTHIPGFDIGDQFRRICLRLMADHLLHAGELVAAVACFAAARNHALYDPFVQGRPMADGFVQIRWHSVQTPAFYYPLWYFAFAHELGHRAEPELIPQIWDYKRVSHAAACTELENSARSSERDYKGLHAADVARGKADAVYPGCLVDEFRQKIPSWVKDLRSEMLADHVATKLIWEVCVDAGRRERKGQPDIIAFFSEVALSLMYLLACQIVGKALSLSGLRDSADKIERLTVFNRFTSYTAIRLGTLIDTMIDSPEIVGMPKLRKRNADKLKRVTESIAPMGNMLTQASLHAIDYVSVARNTREPELDRLLSTPIGTYSHFGDTATFWDTVDEMDLWGTPDILRERFSEIKTSRDRIIRSLQG
ncbi:hypothetical protein [Bradyrhizobium cajani]|uniref:Uncharacterized protein n=1 Tax=Bradyrhizobium cajani TaxID=1928661 RepID=A0A844TII2_9BRAD|nr:hypothetical protein [Bradyrhizobium cajani]MCP3370665.1 hypothetical protein [Bradyrhizobium cajani]MVT75182.1 hypothetical protein [Bradyrhizobium cajani]